MSFHSVQQSTSNACLWSGYHSHFDEENDVTTSGDGDMITEQVYRHCRMFHADIHAGVVCAVDPDGSFFKIWFVSTMVVFPFFYCWDALSSTDLWPRQHHPPTPSPATIHSGSCSKRWRQEE
mmetsp:Transcript_27911/g.46278  ORF Transcript_27911/g.46278 Transcript_27911/m.46278 type:complete len:122 (-) Transcript_27911:143-508(-)